MADVNFLRHRPIVRRHHEDRPVHLRRPRDHVLDVVRVPRTIDVRVVPVRRLVLHVAHRDRDPPLPLLRRIVDRPKIPYRHRPDLRVQHLRDRRRQRRLPVIDVPNRPHVHVRLRPIKLLLGHGSSLSCEGLAGTGPRRVLPGNLRHDLLGDRARHFLVTGELHGVRRPSLGHGAHVGGVAEHLREGHVGTDHLRACPRIHGDDLAAPAVEVAHHRALVLRGTDDLDVHHRLQQDGLGLAAGLLEAHGRGDLERHLARVDFVVAAVRQGDGDVDDRIPRQHAGLGRLLDALLDGGDVLARDGLAP